MSAHDPGAVPTSSLAMVRALEADIAALRATIPREDDQQFRARVEKLLQTEPDPELHDAIWRFKEGSLDRSGLLREPAYGRAMSRRFSEAIDALSPEQTEELHAVVEELREERSQPDEDRPT